MKLRTLVIAVAVAIGTLWLSPFSANALASFARQTGLSCTACHITFPELTPFGRDFKLKAYTRSNDDNLISKDGTSRDAGLSLLTAVPLSIAFETSVTVPDKQLPGSQNPTVEFPQQVNFWLAGQITPHFGTLIQLTYSESADAIVGDSSDVRWVGPETELAGGKFVWGIDANNNPTVEDLWNTTPAFGFAYANPDSAGFLPVTAALIDGGLGGQVIGAGPYFMWDNHLYGLVEVYRSQNLGTPQPENGAGNINIPIVAPYWRVAWQGNINKTNYIEIGTYGIYLNSVPGAISGTADTYLDLAVDLSYELTLASGDMIVLHTTCIRETSNLDASESGTENYLDTFRLDLSYHFGSKLSFTVAPFITWGSSDPLLYAAAPVTGSASNGPDTNGLIVQAACWPWQNFELGLQYRAYLTYNGGSSNYDGNGRNASDNNTFYCFVWFNF